MHPGSVLFIHWFIHSFIHPEPNRELIPASAWCSPLPASEMSEAPDGRDNQCPQEEKPQTKTSLDVPVPR